MRKLLRMAGYIKRALQDLDFRQVPSPNPRKNRRSHPTQLLVGTTVGMLAGRKSLRALEQLSEELCPSVRKLLGIVRPIADTTLRDNLLRFSLHGLRDALRRQIQAALNRKALKREMKLPFHAVALDGKCSRVDNLIHPFVQKHTCERSHRAFGLLRTISCALVSASACPCIDMIPIPGNTNEMGFFKNAFAELLFRFGRMFQVVMYDAGADSRSNAKAVVDAQKDYIFRVKNELRQRYQLMRMLLDGTTPLVTTEDVLSNQVVVKRSLFAVAIPPLKTTKKEPPILWETTKTILSVRSEKIVDGKITESHDFYYDTSLSLEALTPKQWIWLLRRRWGVENDVHNILDRIFEEDDHLGIRTEPDGTLALMILRRIALNIASLFRSVAYRSEAPEPIRFKDILRWVLHMLHALSPDDLDRLRNRRTLSLPLL